MNNDDQDSYVMDKPKGSKRIKSRRNVVRDRYWKTMKMEAAITKTVHDPMNKLTANAMDHLSSDNWDGMGTDVAYSVDKQNRWKVTPATFLENSKNRETRVVVLERSVTHKCYLGTFLFSKSIEDNLRSASYLDKNGNLVENISSKMGTRLKNILTDHKVHKGLKDCDCCRSYNEDPRVEYRIIRAHENQWITTGQITGANVLYIGGPDSVRCHWKRRCLEDMNDMEFEEEYFKDYDIQEENKSYKDRRFCLGDFIVEKKIKKIKSVNKKEWVIVNLK